MVRKQLGLASFTVIVCTRYKRLETFLYQYVNALEEQKKLLGQLMIKSNNNWWLFQSIDILVQKSLRKIINHSVSFHTQLSLLCKFSIEKHWQIGYNKSKDSSKVNMPLLSFNLKTHRNSGLVASYHNGQNYWSRQPTNKKSPFHFVKS